MCMRGVRVQRSHGCGRKGHDQWTPRGWVFWSLEVSVTKSSRWRSPSGPSEVRIVQRLTENGGSKIRKWAERMSDPPW